MVAIASSRSMREVNQHVPPAAIWAPSMLEAPSSPTSPTIPSSSSSSTSLLPSSHALHRAKTARKPLRSSPLAGPALSQVISLNENEHEPCPPSPALSFTFSRSETLLSPPLSAYVRSRSSQELTRPTSMISIYPPATPSSGSSTIISHRRSLIETRCLQRPPSIVHSLLEKSHNESPSAGSSSSGSAGGIELVPRHRRGADAKHNSEAHDMHRRVNANHTAASLTPDASVLRPRSILKPVSTASSTSTSASSSLSLAPPPENSWYVQNEYDVTPKFSRLGLAAAGVVLPVSAKEHRRQSQAQTRRPTASTIARTSTSRASTSTTASTDSSSSGSSSVANTNNKRHSIMATVTASLSRHRSILHPVPVCPPVPLGNHTSASAEDAHNGSGNEDTVRYAIEKEPDQMKEVAETEQQQQQFLSPSLAHSQITLTPSLTRSSSAASSASSLPLSTPPSEWAPCAVPGSMMAVEHEPCGDVVNGNEETVRAGHVIHDDIAVAGHDTTRADRDKGGVRMMTGKDVERALANAQLLGASMGSSRRRRSVLGRVKSWRRAPPPPMPSLPIPPVPPLPPQPPAFIHARAEEASDDDDSDDDNPPATHTRSCHDLHVRVPHSMTDSVDVRPTPTPASEGYATSEPQSEVIDAHSVSASHPASGCDVIPASTKMNTRSGKALNADSGVKAEMAVVRSTSGNGTALPRSRSETAIHSIASRDARGLEEEEERHAKGHLRRGSVRWMWNALVHRRRATVTAVV